MRHPVTRQAFTAWLEQQDDSKVLGVTYEVGACPISNYLHQTNPSFDHICTTYKRVMVDTYDWQYEEYDNPPWLSTVITAIDDLSPDPEEGRIVPVTAGQVKEILRRVP